MQHDENLAIPESPEVSLNCSKVSIGDESSQNEHVAKTPFSPLPQLLKVNTEVVWHLQLGFNNLSTRSCLQTLISQKRALVWPPPAAESGFWSSWSCTWEFSNRNSGFTKN
jgi:hypothetical protein